MEERVWFSVPGEAGRRGGGGDEEIVGGRGGSEEEVGLDGCLVRGWGW